MSKQAERMWAARIIDLYRDLDAHDTDLDYAHETNNPDLLAEIQDRMRELRTQIKILSRRLYDLAEDKPIMVRTGGAMWMIRIRPEQKHYWPTIQRLSWVEEY